MEVRCLNCGASGHPHWQCPRPPQHPKVEKPAARAVPVHSAKPVVPQETRRAVAQGTPAPSRRQPPPAPPVAASMTSLAPPGQCQFCDHRREKDQARLRRHREKKGQDGKPA